MKPVFKTLLPCLGLALSGCVAPDYVAWHPLEGEALAAAASKHGYPRNARGFVELPRDNRPCHMWAAPNDHEAILHELRHCKEGAFHKPFIPTQ